MVTARQILLLSAAGLSAVAAERVVREHDFLVEGDRRNETEVEEGPGEFEIMDWDDEVEESVNQEIEDLEKVKAASLSELGDLAGGGYSYTQLVGLSLYTFPGGMFKANVKEFYTGIAKLVQNHEGSYKYNMEDAERRVTVMQHMMEAAYKSTEYDRSSKVLKIFVAPEFFFRGPYGAYDMRSLEGCTNRNALSTSICNAPIIKIFQMLDKIVRDDKWQDWLFVFGTVVASIGHKNFYNFAPVMRGGSRGMGKHQIVSKTHVSEIDFINCDGQPGQICEVNPINYGIKHYSPFTAKQTEKLNQLGFSVTSRNHFQLDGIHFGVEICLDHAQHTLATHLQGQQVDVHLITSAGMDIGYTSAKSLGPTYLQDGGGGARTSYVCGGCDYLGRGKTELDGYSAATVTYSSQDMDYQAHLQLVKQTIWKDNKVIEVTTPRSTKAWYSSLGFATEGTGAGLDPRFADRVIGKVFATDHFFPTINIGPAFALPSAYQPVPQPLPHTGGGRRHDCQDMPSGVYTNGVMSSCESLKNYCSGNLGAGLVAAAVQKNCRRTCGFC